MKIVVCYKLVPEEQDIVALPGGALSFDRAVWKIGQYDLNAVEAGCRLAAKEGAELAALSVGGAILENSKLRKGILSRGPQQLFTVIDTKLEQADARQTAAALAGALKKLGDADLVLCGEGSGDLYAQQVGIQLGELLGYPVCNAVNAVEAAEPGVLRVERLLEDEIELLEIPLPAVLSVTSGINEPRIPSAKDILAAGKKPVTVWNLSDLPADVPPTGVVEVSTTAYPQKDRKNVVIEGSGEDEIAELYGYLLKELN
ncbi:MAG: putative electron transfer flavoprotein FixA [Desulfovibrio sp.]|nr:putative electron transfer flavoprotein FixA [Desulfovibrio sp.]